MGTARFRCLKELGRGGLGVVYRAYDEEAQREVALKTLRNRSGEDIYFLKEEFRALKDLRHDNLVELYELVVDIDHCFFTMELVDGLPFTEYVWGQDGRTAAGALSEAGLSRLRGALRGLADGLAALHRAEKLHCDVKPSNVLVTPERRVVLLDFDVAVYFGEESLRSAGRDSFAGTGCYASPEQHWSRQPLSPATDWYSVGILLFEVLTGETPSPEDAEKLVREGPRPSLDALTASAPSDLDRLVRALLEHNPEKRAGEADVRRAARETAAVPEPSALSGSRPAPRSPFVGRAREMNVLRTTYEETRRGATSLVYVEGASGIGKSELVRRFLWSIRGEAAAGPLRADATDNAAQRGLPVILCGACHVQESVRYKALDDLVHELYRHLVSPAKGRTVPGAPPYASALTTIFPVLGAVEAFTRSPEGDGHIEPQELRRRGFRALRDVLSQIAAAQPLVLWIDDLQWGDIDSAPFFRELLRPPYAPPLMLILSYRSEDRDQIPLLRDLRKNVEADRIDVRPIALEPLGTEASQELVNELLRGTSAPNGSLAPALVAQSAGSPFFLIELARYAADESSGEALEKADTDRLEQILRRRVTQLKERERRILEVVSIAGRQIDRSLALKAARLGEGGRPDVDRLRVARLVREVEIDGRLAVEIYHDRFRQAVIDSMSADARRARHGEIAEALLAAPSPDPEALFEHYVQAGDKRSASEFVIAAAERAAAALAFERAAERYEKALDLGVPDVPRWRILERRGEALANAGRGDRAGQTFEAAAMELERGTALADVDARSLAIEMRRRAAEQFLRSGHFEPGVAALSRVLRAVGLDYPQSPRRAFASMLLGRARLYMRGLGYRLRRAKDIPPAELARIDACWSAGLGLAWIDLMRTGAFQALYTTLALSAGEPKHVARGLAVEASQVASYGREARLRYGEEQIARARRVAEQAGDPSTSAFTVLMEASIAFYDARWRDALELAQRAEIVLRDRCRSPVWEMTTVRLFSLASLVYLGELATLRTTLPLLLEEARGRGDLLSAASLASGLPNMAWLAADKPDEARERAEEAIELWGEDAFQFQHYLHLVASAQIDLYLGDGQRAWARVTEAWPRLRWSFLLICQNVRMTMLHLRARAAIAMVSQERRSGGTFSRLRHAVRHASLLRSAERDAARLAGEGMRWAAPLAAAVRAELSAVRGRTEEAIPALEHAVRLFTGVDMPLYAAALRYGQGALLGGDQGRLLCQTSEREMRAQGVEQPARLSAALTPGIEP